MMYAEGKGHIEHEIAFPRHDLAVTDRQGSSFTMITHSPHVPFHSFVFPLHMSRSVA